MIKIIRATIQILLFVVVGLWIFNGLNTDPETTKTKIETIAILLAAIITLFIYINFSPKVALRIIPTWIDKNEGILKIRTEIENTSKVICMKKRIRFQILEQKIDAGFVNEFVAFDQEYVELMVPKPEKFTIAQEINLSTSYLYPSEVISTERIYKVNPNLIQHVGLQFETDFGMFKYILWFIKDSVERWTTTIIITKEKN
ncbi:MAG: hypothetical protein IT269_03200 [Saprospiraceae bacterium]|nr:hypothetical protein [Saprospiraceae bacterium]